MLLQAKRSCCSNYGFLNGSVSLYEYQSYRTWDCPNSYALPLFTVPLSTAIGGFFFEIKVLGHILRPCSNHYITTSMQSWPKKEESTRDDTTATMANYYYCFLLLIHVSLTGEHLHGCQLVGRVLLWHLGKPKFSGLATNCKSVFRCSKSCFRNRSQLFGNVNKIYS